MIPNRLPIVVALLATIIAVTARRSHPAEPPPAIDYASPAPQPSAGDLFARLCEEDVPPWSEPTPLPGNRDRDKIKDPFAKDNEPKP